MILGKGFIRVNKNILRDLGIMIVKTNETLYYTNNIKFKTGRDSDEKIKQLEAEMVELKETAFFYTHLLYYIFIYRTTTLRHKRIKFCL